MYHALLFFHMLSAFFLATAIVMYSAFVLGSPVNRTTRLVAEILWGVGGLGTLLFGVWLAFHPPESQIYVGLVIPALVPLVLAPRSGSLVSLAVLATRVDSAGSIY